MEIAISEQRLSPSARRIADAAIDVVAERGYEGLSVRSVAQRAGVTGGAVQHHFSTRGELLTAAFLHTAERIADRLDWPNLTGSPQEWLLLLGDELLPLDDLRRRECTVWVVLSAAAATDGALAAIHRQAVELLTRGISDALSSLPRTDADRVAETVTAALDGLTLHCLTGARSPSEARLIFQATVLSCLPGKSVILRG